MKTLCYRTSFSPSRLVKPAFTPQSSTSVSDSSPIIGEPFVLAFYVDFFPPLSLLLRKIQLSPSRGRAKLQSFLRFDYKLFSPSVRGSLPIALFTLHSPVTSLLVCAANEPPYLLTFNYYLLLALLYHTWYAKKSLFLYLVEKVEKSGTVGEIAGKQCKNALAESSAGTL